MVDLLLQMFGAYYNRLVEKGWTTKHCKMCKMAEFLDINDFLHSNSPYSANYLRPLYVKAPELSVSPPDVVSHPELEVSNRDDEQDDPQGGAEEHEHIDDGGPLEDLTPSGTGLPIVNMYGSNEGRVQRWQDEEGINI